jgi:hypothetical protein
MQTLGMAGGVFEVSVQPRGDASPTMQGLDAIEFLVSANPGQPVQPLSKVASGGELSRISLSIQVISAGSERIPTLIFDEVDSGIGGGVAEIVGQKLRGLAADRQVLCVTHLPQVAAQAHRQLQVSKLAGENTTRTSIRKHASTPGKCWNRVNGRHRAAQGRATAGPARDGRACRREDRQAAPTLRHTAFSCLSPAHQTRTGIIVRILCGPKGSCGKTDAENLLKTVLRCLIVIPGMPNSCPLEKTDERHFTSLLAIFRSYFVEQCNYGLAFTE